MTTTVLALIALGAVLLLGALGEVLFQRTGVPDLLFLMFAGLLLGPVLGLVQQPDLALVAPHVAAIALVFGALEAGGKLKLSGAARPSGRAALLAAIAFAGTVALVVPIAMIASASGVLAPSFTVGHALVLAASLGGPAAALSIPAVGRARLDAPTQALLEGESEVGAALALVFVAITLDVMTAAGDGAGEVLLALVLCTSVGIAVGLVAGIAWILFLRAVRSSDHAFGLTFAALLIVFAIARIAHADALLAIVAFSVVAANADVIGQRLRLGPSPVQATDGVHVRNSLALLVRSSLFVVAGMLMAPPWAAIGLGMLIVLLAAGARVPAVLAATRSPHAEATRRWLLVIAMPRGALALGLALVPMTLNLPAAGEVASVASATVFLSAAAFVVAVLVLQTLKPGELTQGASVTEQASRPVSLIDSTARPAIEFAPSIVAAPANPESPLESGVGPLSTRTPLPLPPPVPPPPRPVPPPVRTAAREIRTTMASEPDIEEIDAQDAPETPRRYPASPVPPPRGSQGGHG